MSTQLVAVYGSLRYGLGNHRLLSRSKQLGECRTTDNWKMYSLGAFPGIVEGGGTILVEVYEVEDGTFQSLDMLEGYPTFYNRKLIPTEFGEAWVYYLNSDRDSPVVESGDWKEHIEERRCG